MPFVVVDKDGMIKTVVGTGKAGSKGVGGPALNTELNGPKHLCADSDGYYPYRRYR